MGMDLSRHDNYDEDGNLVRFGEGPRYNIAGWAWLLETAQRNGWEPVPLTLRGEPYTGGYWYNDGQTVPAENATAWADALEAGKPYDRESERWQEMVDEFISYCRAGAFNIW
jgi:hypothetical protein